VSSCGHYLSPGRTTIAGLIRLRAATNSDARILHVWRNDPTTRASSHNTGEIGYDDHVSWLQRSLANPSRKIFIAEANKKPVGTVRADLENGIWELSWTVAPDERGNGIGSLMVAALATSIKEPIRAEVKASNFASIKIAQSAGMTVMREESEILHFSRDAFSND
jgi:RimJ/RimL family protein N-acetyltransferase